MVHSRQKNSTLDYMCMYGRSHRKHVNDCVLDRGEVIESDHEGLRVWI